MNIQAIGLAQTSQSAPQPELRGGTAARKPEPQQQPVQQKQKPEPTPQQLQQALQTINSKLASSTSLEFSFDKGTKQTVVRVTDKDSGEVIRQFPSEAALAIAESIGEFQKGLLLKQEA
jgi:flagellar protein FlaG